MLPQDRLIESVYCPPRADRPWRLEELLGSDLRYFAYGRQALIAAFKLAGIEPGDPVLMPEFICREVPEAARAISARPAYLRVDPQLGCADDPAQWPKAKAVIAVNYFGFAQNLEPFRRYCARNKALLIEDNAHGLFSRDDEGRWLGTRGDAGIFSLRKTLTLPNGAALALPNESSLVMPRQDPFGAAPAPRYRIKQAARRIAPWIGFRSIRAGLKFLRRWRKPPTSSPGPRDSKPCAALSRPLDVGNPEVELRRRQELYRFAERIAAGKGAQSVFTTLPPLTAPYVYPFYAEPRSLPAIRAALDEAGLDIHHWPLLPEEVQAAASPHHLKLWCVPFLW